MLDIRKLRAGYGAEEILHGVDLSIPTGSVTVVVGPNGCGKSTLLKTIAGIHPAAEGRIVLDGVDLGTLTPRLRAQQVSYLSQSRQPGDLSAERMVLHGRFPYLSYPRRYGRADLEIARQAMETMGVTDMADRNLNTLSGGQRQKVYIAMILAQDTPLVLLDEPTTYLDIAHQMQTMAHARFLARQGKTVVLVLHDLSAALRNADHLVVMGSGRVLRQGSGEEVFASHSLDEAFGIRLERFRTESGWQYYYRESENWDCSLDVDMV